MNQKLELKFDQFKLEISLAPFLLEVQQGISCNSNYIQQSVSWRSGKCNFSAWDIKVFAVNCISIYGLMLCILFSFLMLKFAYQVPSFNIHIISFRRQLIYTYSLVQSSRLQKTFCAKWTRKLIWLMQFTEATSWKILSLFCCKQNVLGGEMTFGDKAEMKEKCIHFLFYTEGWFLSEHSDAFGNGVWGWRWTFKCTCVTRHWPIISSSARCILAFEVKAQHGQFI